MKHKFLLLASAALLPLAAWSQNISFADEAVKQVCVSNWDTNGDSELSQDEAAAVTSLGTLFRSNQDITTFTELEYFTGLEKIDAKAFMSCRNLTEVIIPQNVTTLEAEAFKESGLTSIVLPANVENVGSECFWGCSSLAAIDLGSVKRIENSAFSNLESLTSITIPGTWTDRDGSCWAEFAWNPNLETVIVGEGIVDFPWYVFTGCPKLSNVTLPSTLGSISAAAFSGCSSLKNINLPSKLTVIADEAFFETGLTGVLLPATVETVGNKAFMNCASLTTLGLSSLKEAGDSAFANCTSLKMVDIPATISGEKGAGIFAGCTQLNYVSLSEGIATINPGMFQNCQMLTNITLPASLVAVADSAFKCSGLTSIVLPSAVGSLGTESFWGCGALTSIDLGNVKKAGRDVFGECNALASVTIPATWHSLEYEGENVWGSFANCHNLQKVIFREGVTTLDAVMFAGCEKLSSVTLPSSLINISWAAFSGCTNLKSITIPNKVKSIEGEAFKESGLISIVLPPSVEHVGPDCFWGCASVNTIDLGSVKRIEASAFSNMESLTSITIPGTWTERDEYCWAEFAYNPNLETVVVSEGIENFPWHVFTGCPKLSNVTLPSSLQSVDTGAFSGCTSLKNITLPDNLTSIGSEAFQGTGLGYVALPASVTEIGETAFADCENLACVEVLGEEPANIAANSFSNDPKLVVYVKAGVGDLYIGTENWKDLPINERATIAEGTYYLKNVGTGMYLTRGADWGRRAVLSTWGLPVQFNLQPNGDYQIYFPNMWFNQSLLFRGDNEDVWVDYNGQTNPETPNWTITIAADGNLRIQSAIDHPYHGQAAEPGTFLGNRPEDGEIVNGNVTEAEGMNIDWRLVPVDDYADYKEIAVKISELERIIESVAAMGIDTSEAQALIAQGTATAEELDEAIGKLLDDFKAALAENLEGAQEPIDITALVQNPSFSNDMGDYWTATEGTGFDLYCDNAEYYEKTFDIHQTITGLPVGNYLVKVKGFHRPGDPNQVYADYKQGNDNVWAELYANGQSVKLQNIAVAAQDEQINGCGLEVTYDKQTQYLPNWMWDTKQWFDNGYYENELAVAVTDGTLTLGIRSEQTGSMDWVIFDDFQLFYLESCDLINVTNALVAGYSSDRSIDFTKVDGASAWIATGFRGGNIQLSRIYTVPANTGIYVKADNAGVVAVPRTTEKAYYVNMFQPVVKSTTIEPIELVDGVSYQTLSFALSNTTGKPMFFPNTEAKTYGNNKMYLRLPEWLLANEARELTVDQTFETTDAAEAVETEELTVGSAKVAGFSSNKNLDFTKVKGVSAWIATGFSGGNIQLSRVYAVPAGTGLYIKADAPGTFKIPVTTEVPYYVNLFVGVPNGATIPKYETVSGEKMQTLTFALSQTTGKPMFFPNEGTKTYGKNKMYLRLPASLLEDEISARGITFEFEGEETTGISDFSESGNGEMVNDDSTGSAQVYDLQGRRIETSNFNVQTSKLNKGLYIQRSSGGKNGRKVIMR